jgi:ssDNA-binding Zn-finger/Zn-ribbon topoisomerase 1
MANLEGIWLDFLEPDFTRRVEEKLDLVMETQQTRDAVVIDVKTEFLKIFDSFRASKVQITQALSSVQPGSSFVKAKKTAKREQYSKENCPSCGNALMKVVKTQNKSRFLACTDPVCKFTLALPKIGRLVFLKTKCSICGFSPVKVTKSIKKTKKTYDYFLCPNCWTRSLGAGEEQKEEQKGGFCKNCPAGKIERFKCVPKQSRLS